MNFEQRFRDHHAATVGARQLEQRMLAKAGRLSLLYLILGIAWIFGSDTLLEVMIGDPNLLAVLQTVKGGFYVVITAFLLYLLLKPLVRNAVYANGLLGRSEATYRAMFESNPNPMCIHNPATREILEVNAAAIEFYGWTREEFLVLSLYDLWPPSDRAALEEVFRTLPPNGLHRSKYVHCRKNGEQVDVEVHGHPISFQGRTARLAMIYDYSAKSRAQKLIEQTLARMQEAQEIAHLGSWNVDPENGRMRGSAQIYRLLGLEPASASESLSFVDLFAYAPKDEQPKLRRLYETLITQRQALDVVHHLRRADGEIRLVQTRGEALVQPDGSVLVQGTVQDITEAQRLRQLLEEREEQFHQLVAALPDGVLILFGVRFRYANLACANLFGIDNLADFQKNFHSHPLKTWIAPDDLSPLRKYANAVRRQQRQGERLVCTLRKIDGAAFRAELTARPVSYNGRDCLLFVIRDLTEAECMRDRLAAGNTELQAMTKRLFSLQEDERRTLSRELHDDIGQVITAMKLSTQSLRHESREERRLAGIGEISDMADHAIGKLRDLAMMLRPPQLDSLGLEAALRWQVGVLFRDKNISVDLQIKTLPRHPGSEVELACFRIAQECMTNILRHAQARKVSLCLHFDCIGLQLEICDDGRGFAAGAAAGLGLITMRERAQLVGGRLQVESTVGKGTCIRAELPFAVIEPDAADADSEADREAEAAIQARENHIEHKRRDRDLRRFRAAMDATDDAIYLIDRADMRIVDVNEAACRLHSSTREELFAMRPEALLLTERDELESTYDAIIASGMETAPQQMLLQSKDGAQIWLELKHRPQRSGDGWMIVTVVRDITGRKVAEQANDNYAWRQSLIVAFSQKALADTELDELYAQAMAVIAEGLDVEFCYILQLSADNDWVTLKAGAGWEQHWIGRRIADGSDHSQARYVLSSRAPVVIDDCRQETRFAPSEILAAHDIASGVEILVPGADGPYGIVGAYSREPGAFPSDCVSFLQSIANSLEMAVRRKNSEEKVAYLAQFDALTNLPNWNLFHDRIGQALMQARRSGRQAGILLIDLDRFKDINDSYGHGAGDNLLKLVAQRLQETVRTGDTVGRLDGDKFGVVLSNLAKTDDANLVAKKVIAALANPFNLSGQPTSITASLGISLFPNDGGAADTLLTNADTAMRQAKEQGRNNFQFYTEELNTRAMRRIVVERELRQAIERQEFELHYQPQVSLDSGRIVGAEALIRWRHPQRGLLAPADFLPVAEQTGLIIPIGRWVLETACAQAAQWHLHHHDEIVFSVNVSPAEFRHGRVPENVRSALAKSGLDPRFLEIELTETLVMDGAEQFKGALAELKAVGVTIAIDNFGTGYSSLSYLKRFPIDKVKIDRSFIRDIVTDSDDAAIVRAVIAMSHQLKLKVLAQGVETVQQAGFLHRSQCDLAQGALLGQPTNADGFRELLDSHIGQSRRWKTNSSPRSLLIVDDEENIQRALKRELRGEGYEIFSATSAREALELMAQTHISVIMSDQRMPGMTGTELLDRVKVLYPDTVRIVLSGYTDLATVSALINEGAIYKFLTKPWEDNALREDIRQAFRLYEQQTAGRSTASS